MSDWIYDPTYNPTDWWAFIYKITLPDGRWYVGKKSLWTCKAKKISKESDWKKYWSSSQEVKDAVAQFGEANCSREITKFCLSPGEASLHELLALVNGPVMPILDPKCLNKNVLMTFNKKTLTGYADDARREQYLKDIKKQKKAAGLEDGE